MKTIILFFVFIPLGFNAQKEISSIAFGSCANQNKNLPILRTIVEHHPDLFIFLGDNIYGDTEDMSVMQAKYEIMANHPNFKYLKDSVPLIATWDDHDYGADDIGRHYSHKKASKKLFLKFFDEPFFSKRRCHKGIYTSYFYESHGKTIQVILLDLRTFRDDLLPYDGSLKGDSTHAYELDYSPYTTGDSTMLGEKQWKWLEKELKKPASIRIIGSSTQFGTEYNGYETWSNFPHEQQRMLELIDKTQAKGVLFISGDLHYSEFSKIDRPNSYPIYDLTASGLTEEWKFSVPNKNRIDGPIMDNHFGLISFDWTNPDTKITLEIWDFKNQLRIHKEIFLSELQ